MQTVRARGYPVLLARSYPLIFGAAAWMTGVRGAWLTAAVVAIAVFEVLTLRLGVVASSEGVQIRSLIRTRWIAEEQVVRFEVARVPFLWFTTIDLMVLLQSGERLRVPWVSWFTGFEALLTVPAAPLPKPQQERVLARLTAGLGRPNKH